MRCSRMVTVVTASILGTAVPTGAFGQATGLEDMVGAGRTGGGGTAASRLCEYRRLKR